MSSIPIVDMKAPDRAAALAQALSGLGFFYLAGHGVDASVFATARDEAERFFSRPAEFKAALRANARHRGYVGLGDAVLSDGAPSDVKESFVWGVEREPASHPLEGPNRWPDDASMRNAFEALLAAACDAGHRLLPLFARAIDEPPAFFTRHYRRPLARASAIRYPGSARESMGTTAHTDYGALTLLWQDDVGGLQVQSGEGTWIDVTPLDGTLVVNVGDLMERWSAWRFRSTRHRVLSPRGRDRYSLAVFFDPDPDTVIEGVCCGDYIRSRFDAVFPRRSSA